jgi:di/tricarboxylate transporter
MEEFKDPTRTPETYKRLRSLSRNCGGLVILIGLLVLAGWIFDITVLKSIRYDTVPMNPVVALTFIAAGVALWLKQEKSGDKYNKKADWLCYFILAVGVLKLISILTGIRIPFDEILFHDRLWIPRFHTLSYYCPKHGL